MRVRENCFTELSVSGSLASVQATAKSGFGIISVLLVALLAFLLGHYATSLMGGAGLGGGHGAATATGVVKAVNATVTGKHTEL